MTIIEALDAFKADIAAIAQKAMRSHNDLEIYRDYIYESREIALERIKTPIEQALKALEERYKEIQDGTQRDIQERGDHDYTEGKQVGIAQAIAIFKEHLEKLLKDPFEDVIGYCDECGFPLKEADRHEIDIENASTGRVERTINLYKCPNCEKKE